MSDKFEECTLGEATHIEVNGKIHKLNYADGNQVLRYNSHHIEVCRKIEVHTTETRWQLIHVDAFPILGIKPIKEKKRKPIEFEAIVKQSKLSYWFLGNVPEGVPLGTRFHCVQILEEEEK